MADYNSSLPVRSEADADERIQSKLVDYTTPTQGMTIDAQGNAHVEVHGDNPAGNDETLRLSELGSASVDGVYDGTNNTDPSNVGLVVCNRAATPADTDQVKRLTGVTSSTVHALDVAIRDESGAAFTPSNPLPVTVVDSEGSEVNDFKQASSVAAGASDDHDYTVTAATTLKLTQVEASASGKMKMVLATETGVGTGVFNTKFVKFNSTANPNCSNPIKEAITVAAGVRVRVTLTNLDNQGQDLYSTISGHEIS